MIKIKLEDEDIPKQYKKLTKEDPICIAFQLGFEACAKKVSETTNSTITVSDDADSNGEDMDVRVKKGSFGVWTDFRW